MIGFDTGGTKCAVCIGEETDGKLLIKDKRVIPADKSVTPQEMIDRMCALAEETEDLFKRYPSLEICRKDIESALKLMIDTYRNGGKVLVCGNGGSAADSEHIVGELMKGFMLKRPVCDERIPDRLKKNLQGALPAISLPSQSAILSAYINDVEPDMMYAQLVYGYAKENDLVIGISTSGNSKNVVNAAEVARCLNVKTLALTGMKESRLSELCDVTVKVPETETYKVQELHLPVYHCLCAETEKAFFA